MLVFIRYLITSRLHFPVVDVNRGNPHRGLLTLARQRFATTDIKIGDNKEVLTPKE